MVGTNTLLVEGPDDEHVLKHLCGTRGVPRIDAILSRGGVDRLLESFPVHLKAAEEGDVVGVVIDADTNMAARWQALRDRLVQTGYVSVPDAPEPTGSILAPPVETLLPRVGIWIMPNNQTNGTLEDFLHFLIPAGSRLFDHVKACVRTIPDGERRFSALAEPKALIHTWLAWQVDPGYPLSTAITARYLDPDVPQVDVLVNWLRRLFFQGPE